MRERTLMTAGGGVNPSESAACDICFYDKDNDKLIIVPKNKWNTTDYSVDRYTPIGVVVVPGSHNVYDNGSCGVMSLKYMRYDTPNEGSTTRQGICWGGYNVETSLKNLNLSPYIDSNIAKPSIGGTDTVSYLPSDNFTGHTSAQDTKTKYYNADNDRYAPSPYDGNGNRNPLYYDTSSATTANCLADFDGVGNTAVLTSLAKGQSNWKTAATISNSSDPNYYPAACCCWRYSTEGTKQGDWYLPAAGEFGYVIARLKAINETISALRAAYGSTNISSVVSYDFWSSSEDSGTSARGLYTNGGGVGSYGKDSTNYVRAFLRV